MTGGRQRAILLLNFAPKSRARRVARHAFSGSRSPSTIMCMPASVRQGGGLRAACVATANGAYTHMPHHPPWTRLLTADRGLLRADSSH